MRRDRNPSQERLTTVGNHTNVQGRYARGEANSSIDISAKLAEALSVTLDQLVGRAHGQADKPITDKVLTIERIPEKDRDHILYTLDAMLCDARSCAAYG